MQGGAGLLGLLTQIKDVIKVFRGVKEFTSVPETRKKLEARMQRITHNNKRQELKPSRLRGTFYFYLWEMALNPSEYRSYTPWILQMVTLREAAHLGESCGGGGVTQVHIDYDNKD